MWVRLGQAAGLVLEILLKAIPVGLVLWAFGAPSPWRLAVVAAAAVYFEGVLERRVLNRLRYGAGR